MGGIGFAAGGQAWSVSSSIFYWAIDVLAEQVQDQVLAEQLREISTENLGSMDVEELPAEHLRDLSVTAARLPALARTTLPESDQREVIIRQIEELADLLTRSAGPSGVGGHQLGAP